MASEVPPFITYLDCLVEILALEIGKTQTMKLLPTIIYVTLAGAAMSPNVKAAGRDQRTIVTFCQTVEIPGIRVIEWNVFPPRLTAAYTIIAFDERTAERPRLRDKTGSQ